MQLYLTPIGMHKAQLLSMQGQTINQRAFRLIGLGTITSLEVAEPDSALGWGKRMIQRIDHQRMTNRLEMHANLVRLTRARKNAQKRSMSIDLFNLP